MSSIGFYELKHHAAKDYEQLIREIVFKLNLDISKCRGQGYDGAAVMSGKYKGVQIGVKKSCLLLLMCIVVVIK